MAALRQLSNYFIWIPVCRFYQRLSYVINQNYTVLRTTTHSYLKNVFYSKLSWMFDSNANSKWKIRKLILPFLEHHWELYSVNWSTVKDFGLKLEENLRPSLKKIGYRILSFLNSVRDFRDFGMNFCFKKDVHIKIETVQEWTA